MDRVTGWLGIRSAPISETPAIIGPPARDVTVWTAPASAATLSSVFTCVQIVATAVEQISIDAERAGLPLETSGFIARPDETMSRPAWLHMLTVCLALYGNAYLLVERDKYGQPLNASPLPPAEVGVYRDPATNRVRYSWHGRDGYTPAEIVHLQFLRTPGRITGLGPIQAAQPELRSARDLSDAGHAWFGNAGTPSGIISTTAALTPTQAAEMMDAWNAVPAGRTRLITNGGSYSPVSISPKDAQWLESRQFSKTEIADLFGIPASLILGVDKGTSTTYSNIEQDWLGFVRFRLMRYINEIETALTGILPRGQRARFNIESLLRTDSKTRMEIHQIAISAGVYSPAWARAIEHIPEGAAQ